jgi:hypothetical protein
MEKEYTLRGFAIYQFQDYLKVNCSLQKSSLADIDTIWLGVDDDRMELTRSQVKELLPILKKFVRKGEI